MADNKLKWWDAFIPIVIFFASQIVITVLAILLSLIFGMSSGNNMMNLRLSPGLGIAAAVSFILSAVFIFIYIKFRKISFKEVGLNKFNINMVWQVIGAFFLILIIGVAYDYLLRSFGINADTQIKSMLDMFGKSKLGLIAMGITVAILAPFVEELVFRGFLFRYLDSVMSFWAAAGISALIFAVMHFYPIHLPVLLLMGFLLAYLVKKADSIWPSVMLHFIYNSIVFVMMYKYFI